MPLPKDLLAAVRTHLDIEIQSGRRRQPLDPAVVAAFLAPPSPPPSPAPAVATAPSAAAAPFAPTRPAVGRPASVGAGTDPGEVARVAAAAPDVGAVAEAVRACRLCSLAATRTKSVPGVGNADSPPVLFVGEAPGRDEDLRGEPFVGRAGQLLDKMIAAMGFSRAEVFIANVLKCRPPDNRTPTPDEMALCLPFLRRQIELVRPRVIVALGATAYRGLTGDPGANISKFRGLWQKFGDIPLMPTFHPAYLLRAPAAKRVVWQDLQKVLAFLGRTPPPIPKK